MEFRLSIIDLGTALDIDVEEITRRVLKSRGKFNAEYDRKLDAKTVIPIVEEILIKNIEEDILNSKQYNEIKHEFIKVLRNPVIHDAYEPTKEQVTNAFKIVKEFRQLLSKITIKSTG